MLTTPKVSETGTKATSSSHQTSSLLETQLAKSWTGPAQLKMGKGGMHNPISCNVLCFYVMLATALPHSSFS